MSDILINHSAPMGKRGGYFYKASCGKREAYVSFDGGSWFTVCVMNASHRAHRGLGGRHFESIRDALDAYKSPEVKSIIRSAALAALEYWRDLDKIEGRHELMIEICKEVEGVEPEPIPPAPPVKTRKATKADAKRAYDNFHGTLRCFNGGTLEENERNAKYCYDELTKQMPGIELIASNPGKLLRGDRWLWESISERIPSTYAKFAERYPHVLGPDIPDNIIQFNQHELKGKESSES